VELYNFKLLDPQGPWDLSNLTMLHTFSGGMDEAWFYLISLAMEAAGAPAIPAILEGLRNVEVGDVKGLSGQLETVAKSIDEINKILVRMYEKVCAFQLWVVLGACSEG
jgi:indoleamine 2,3-dioxygenase